jgi:hypothetical protein
MSPHVINTSREQIINGKVSIFENLLEGKIYVFCAKQEVENLRICIVKHLQARSSDAGLAKRQFTSSFYRFPAGI